MFVIIFLKIVLRFINEDLGMYFFKLVELGKCASKEELEVDRDISLLQGSVANYLIATGLKIYDTIPFTDANVYILTRALLLHPREDTIEDNIGSLCSCLHENNTDFILKMKHAVAFIHSNCFIKILIGNFYYDLSLSISLNHLIKNYFVKFYEKLECANLSLIECSNQRDLGLFYEEHDIIKYMSLEIVLDAEKQMKKLNSIFDQILIKLNKKFFSKK